MNNLRDNLVSAFENEKLPGEFAHHRMRPQIISGSPNEYNKDLNLFTKASVLIIIFNKENSWHLPLIKRAPDNHIHGGQIALPGGRIEMNESIIDAALREANEEVGIKLNKSNVLGILSPLSIPISQYLVHPVVAVYEDIPHFKLCHREVADLFLINEFDLKNKYKRTSMEQIHRGKSYKIPYFNFQQRIIWGATAMILSEFIEFAGLL